MTSHLLSRIVRGGFVASLAVLFVGCLEGEGRVALRYDKDKDQFALLTVYEHIRGAPEGQNKVYDLDADFNRVQALYANRDHLVIFDFFRILGGPPAFLRMADGKHVKLSLENAPIQPADPNQPAPDASLPLKQAQILPGSLFLNGDGDLCYYHQLLIPGRAVDDALQTFKTNLKDNGTEDIDKELKSREDGRARVPLPQATKLWVADLERPDDQPRPDNAEKPELLATVDTETLQRLRDAFAKGTLDIGRKGTIFHVVLPMTASDAKELPATFDALKDALIAKATRDLEKSAREKHQPAAALDAAKQTLQRLRDAVTAKATDAGVQITADILPIADALWLMGGQADLSAQPDELKHAAEMATRAIERLPVKRDLTLDKVYADFKSANLPANPSTKPVEPGTGLSD